jgi:hypothetical protein
MLDNFGLFLTGFIFALSLLRLVVIWSPQWLLVLLGLTEKAAFSLLQEDEPVVNDLLATPHEPDSWCNFLRIFDFSEELRLRFARHQELLLEGDIQQALSSIELFRTQLLIHVTEENKIVIPLYLENCPLPKKDKERDIHSYFAENKKFINILQEIVDRLREMRICFVTKKSADILYILELDMRFKAILRRHESSEVRKLYRGAQYGLSEEERAEVWKKALTIRQQLGFRLGNLDMLTDGKINMVQQNWFTYKDRFVESLVEVSKEMQTPLPFSEKVRKDVQGYSEGLAEATFVDTIVNNLLKFDKEVIRRVRSHLPCKLAVNESDHVIGLFLQALEKSQDGPLTACIKEAWANVLNVAFNSYSEEMAYT